MDPARGLMSRNRVAENGAMSLSSAVCWAHLIATRPASRAATATSRARPDSPLRPSCGCNPTDSHNRTTPVLVEIPTRTSLVLVD
jgi:hypothetical protein